MKGVQQGYYNTYEETFVTSTRGYGTFGVPKELRTDENKDEDYVEVYRTTDGKLFLDNKAAETHEKTVDASEVQKVKELLEKAKILADKSKDKFPLLSAVSDALGRIQNDPDELMEKYYDSTC